MSRRVTLDCTHGLGGDLILGALCDLGVAPTTLEWELSKLDAGEFHLHFDKETRDTLQGIHFTAHAGKLHGHGGCDHDHGCEHDSHDHSDHESHEHGETLDSAEWIASLEACDFTPFIEQSAVATLQLLFETAQALHLNIEEDQALVWTVTAVAVPVALEALEVSQIEFCSRAPTDPAPHLRPPEKLTRALLEKLPGRSPGSALDPVGAALAGVFATTFSGEDTDSDSEKTGIGFGDPLSDGRPHHLVARLTNR